MVDRAFHLTPLAAEKTREALIRRKTPNARLRVGVKGGGCSGLRYVLMFEDSPPRKGDIVLSYDGVDVIVDKKSIVYLNGASLDWQKTLMHQGYRFVNPHEKSNCGCNESFSV